MGVAVGWYELVGQPQVGKTTLAALLAKHFQDVLWVWGAQEVSEGILAEVGLEPACQLVVTTVSQAFEVIKEVGKNVDLAVLDSLAGLSPDHPQATRIAPDVARNIFIPEVPVLVVNQVRYPAPPGGVRWASLVSRRELAMFRDRPALLSQLIPDEEERWLLWYPGSAPAFRKLEDRDQIWFPESEVVYGRNTAQLGRPSRRPSGSGGRAWLL